jgi:aldehyde dehydrogenase (NAD+)
VGKVVMAAAARHLTPVTLELGGKSPTIVAADADIGVAARRIVWGKLINAGQTCIAPDYLLVEDAVVDELIDRIRSTIRSFYGDDPAGSADLGRIVNERHFDRVCGLVDGGGGTVVIGGGRDRTTRKIEPTVVLDPDLDSPLMAEEIFGPVLPVVRVASIDQAIDAVNSRPKPLALYVFTSSNATADRVIASTSSGGACVNHVVVHVLPESLPFGGVGPSGMGAYHGRAGFDAFSHRRTVLRKPTRPDPAMLYPPYTKAKESLIRRVLR